MTPPGWRATLLPVALGGAVGALLRHLVTTGAGGATSTGFPVGTLIGNVVGAAGLGLLVAVPVTRLAQESRWRPLLGAGVCGGLSTFSTLTLEVVRLADGGAVAAALYALTSLLLLPLSVLAGALLARPLGGPR